MKTNNEQIYNVLLEMKEEIGEMRADLITIATNHNCCIIKV